MKFPVIHNTVFGHARLLPVLPPSARLGEPPGPTMPGEQAAYQKALAYYEGIRKNFESLTALIGDSAEKALAQAKASYEEALKGWTASKGARI